MPLTIKVPKGDHYLEMNSLADLRGAVRRYLYGIAVGLQPEDPAHAHVGAKHRDDAVRYLRHMAREFGTQPIMIYQAADLMTQAIALTVTGTPLDVALTQVGYAQLPMEARSALEAGLGRMTIAHAIRGWRDTTFLHEKTPRGFNTEALADVFEKGNIE